MVYNQIFVKTATEGAPFVKSGKSGTPNYLFADIMRVHSAKTDGAEGLNVEKLLSDLRSLSGLGVVNLNSDETLRLLNILLKSASENGGIFLKEEANGIEKIEKFDVSLYSNNNVLTLEQILEALDSNKSIAIPISDDAGELKYLELSIADKNENEINKELFETQKSAINQPSEIIFKLSLSYEDKNFSMNESRPVEFFNNNNERTYEVSVKEDQTKGETFSSDKVNKNINIEQSTHNLKVINSSPMEFEEIDLAKVKQMGTNKNIFKQEFDVYNDDYPETDQTETVGKSIKLEEVTDKLKTPNGRQKHTNNIELSELKEISAKEEKSGEIEIQKNKNIFEQKNVAFNVKKEDMSLKSENINNGKETTDKIDNSQTLDGKREFPVEMDKKIRDENIFELNKKAVVEDREQKNDIYFNKDVLSKAASDYNIKPSKGKSTYEKTNVENYTDPKEKDSANISNKNLESETKTDLSFKEKKNAYNEFEIKDGVKKIEQIKKEIFPRVDAENKGDFNAKEANLRATTSQIKPGFSEFGSNISMKTVRIGELLSETAKFIKTQSRQSLTIQIEPESLGKVEIILDMKDKLVNAKIEVENEAVKSIIENNAKQLQSSLIQSGVQLNSLSISIANSDQKHYKQNGAKKRNSSDNENRKAINNKSDGNKIKKYGYNTYEYLA